MFKMKNNLFSKYIYTTNHTQCIHLLYVHYRCRFSKFWKEPMVSKPKASHVHTAKKKLIKTIAFIWKKI